MAKTDEKYADPELRSQIKEDIQAGDKGGQPGQWSARKAQMMASEYKKQMHERGEEPYTTDKSELSDSQKHLNSWTKEEWQTSEGSGNAKQVDGTEKRYLPKKAWESMTNEEKEETNKAKLEGSARGKQFIANTGTAKKARKDAQEARQEDRDGNEPSKSNEEDTSPKHDKKHKRDTDEKAADEAKSEEKSAEDDGVEDLDETTKSEPPAKRAKGDDEEAKAIQSHSNVNPADGDSENHGEEDKQKDIDNEHGQPCSATRLPKEGQEVFWRATPGWVEGTVIEIAYSEKEVDGKHVKASQDDPRIVLQSAKSGKIAVHKPTAVYF